MNTAQLIVLWYAALSIIGVLLCLAFAHESASFLIVVIIVFAALLIYFLKPHPAARKRWVLAAVFLPIAISSAGFYGWLSYINRKAEQPQNVTDEMQVNYDKAAELAKQLGLTISTPEEMQQQRLLEQMKTLETAREEEEKAWLVGRFKIGDRVSALNEGMLEFTSGVFSYPKKSRLYGTIVDTQFDPQYPRRERYAVKWDGGDVVWIDGRDTLQRLSSQKKKPAG